MTLDKTLEIINFPDISATLKVVQLELDRQYYLRFGRVGKELYEELHCVILKNFLESAGIGLSQEELKFHLPNLEGERYKVHGMGFSKIDVEQRILQFWGESETYRIRINREHLDSIKETFSEWKFDY